MSSLLISLGKMSFTQIIVPDTIPIQIKYNDSKPEDMDLTKLRFSANGIDVEISVGDIEDICTLGDSVNYVYHVLFITSEELNRRIKHILQNKRNGRTKML